MKERIKRLSIISIIVIIVFTAVSRISNSITTAAATTQKAVSGRITHKISASGKVESASEFAVLVPENLSVEEVCVKEGELVEAGGILLQTAGNTPLSRAKEDFSAWERKASIDLQESADAYLLAYEEWQRYLSDTKGWYWKADDDQKEDGLELSVREKEYQYFKCYKQYLENYRNKEKRPKSHSECEAAQSELTAAKNEYWEYRQTRERPYQFIRKEDEKKYREALEKAVPVYRDALEEYENSRILKIRQIEDASSSLLDENGDVTAPVSGIVKEIRVKEGEKTTSSAAVVIAESTGKKRITVQVGADMEEYLAPGDSSVLKRYGSGEEITGQPVTDVRYNEEDSSLLDVTVEVLDDTLSVGDLVTVEISKQSEQYPFVIPNDAVHMGQGETFVFAVKESESILGFTLKAEKLPIKILERSGDYAAISGEGILDAQIVTGTDREIEEGSRIRKKVL